MNIAPSSLYPPDGRLRGSKSHCCPIDGPKTEAFERLLGHEADSNSHPASHKGVVDGSIASVRQGPAPTETLMLFLTPDKHQCLGASMGAPALPAPPPSGATTDGKNTILSTTSTHADRDLSRAMVLRSTQATTVNPEPSLNRTPSQTNRAAMTLAAPVSATVEASLSHSSPSNYGSSHDANRNSLVPLPSSDIVERFGAGSVEMLVAASRIGKQRSGEFTQLEKIGLSFAVIEQGRSLAPSMPINLNGSERVPADQSGMIDAIDAFGSTRLAPASHLRLTLQPVDLGRIDISLQLRQDRLNFSLATARSATLELFERSRDHLQTSLSKAGYEVAGVDLRLLAETTAAERPEQRGELERGQDDLFNKDDQRNAKREALAARENGGQSAGHDQGDDQPIGDERRGRYV